MQTHERLSVGLPYSRYPMQSLVLR
jgi:hypothetical protein